jgi:hypothetical protein
VYIKTAIKLTILYDIKKKPNMLSARLLWFLGGTLFGLGTMLFAQQLAHPARRLIVKKAEQNAATPSVADETAASVLQFGHPGL